MDVLLDLIAAVDKELGNLPADTSLLTTYSVEARYPGDSPEVTIDEAAQAVALAAQVRDAVKQRLSDFSTAIR